MTRTIDFDAYRAEQAAEPVTIKIGGEVYSLAAGLPAEVALEVVDFKSHNGSDAALPNDRIIDLAKKLFGADVFDALITTHHLTTNELSYLIVQVFAEYNSTTLPNPTAPKRSGRTRTKRSNSA